MIEEEDKLENRNKEGDFVSDQFKLLEVVALAVDLPDHNLWRGQVGTVVEILANGTAFEVEFSDHQGRSYLSLGLRPEQIKGVEEGLNPE